MTNIKVVNGVRTIKLHLPRDHRRSKVVVGTRDLGASIQIKKVRSAVLP